MKINPPEVNNINKTTMIIPNRKKRKLMIINILINRLKQKEISL
jgi:hypothetical protein